MTVTFWEARNVLDHRCKSYSNSRRVYKVVYYKANTCLITSSPNVGQYQLTYWYYIRIYCVPSLITGLLDSHPNLHSIPSSLRHTILCSYFWALRPCECVCCWLVWAHACSCRLSVCLVLPLNRPRFVYPFSWWWTFSLFYLVVINLSHLFSYIF